MHDEEQEYHPEVEVTIQEVRDAERITYTATVDRVEALNHIIDRAVAKAVEQHVEQALKSDRYSDNQAERPIARLVEELAAPRIEKMLDEGWTTFSTYGQPKLNTLTEAVANYLGGKTSEYHGETNLMKAVKQAVEKCFDKAFQGEIAKAQASFRTQVDALMTAKIADGLRAAFGLSR